MALAEIQTLKDLAKEMGIEECSDFDYIRMDMS